MQNEAAKAALPARSWVTDTIKQGLRDERFVLQRWKKAKSPKREWVDELHLRPPMQMLQRCCTFGRQPTR
jgi:hypothetical protein